MIATSPAATMLTIRAPLISDPHREEADQASQAAACSSHLGRTARANSSSIRSTAV